MNEQNEEKTKGVCLKEKAITAKVDSYENIMDIAKKHEGMWSNLGRIRDFMVVDNSTNCFVEPDEIRPGMEVTICPIMVIPRSYTPEETVIGWFEEAKKHGRTEINLYYKPNREHFDKMTEEIENSPYVRLIGTDDMYQYIYNGAVIDCQEILVYIGKYQHTGDI